VGTWIVAGAALLAVWAGLVAARRRAARREAEARARNRARRNRVPLVSANLRGQSAQKTDIWRDEKNATTGASSQSLLWNLYRNERTPEAKKCSLLFGLFQYQKGPEGKRVRLFYVPLGKGTSSNKQ